MVSPKAAITLVLSLVLHYAHGYVPARPTNSSEIAISGGLNVTDTSRLDMHWYSQGSYTQFVSYQLAGLDTRGISKGVLVHFSEESVNETTPGTDTPWIAMVSCDKNATNASMDTDIFTLARDKGAVAALLYTLGSLACVINPEYADPDTFDQVFDIFSTQSMTSAHLIEYQFGQLNPQNTSIFGYTSSQLNKTGDHVRDSISAGYATSEGYLYAVLRAWNATDTDSPSNPGGGGTNTTEQGGRPGQNTALAMIVLYAITGVVSALFCVVIITGAIRAIRHPERYGPRPRGPDGGQSRARGLTRAILDTFPIVKFGTGSNTPSQDAKDLESSTSRGGPLELTLTRSSLRFDDAIVVPTEDTARSNEPQKADSKNDEESHDTDKQANEATSSTPPPTRRPPKVSENAEASGSAINNDVRHDVMPSSIGVETCPICIVDFEEGDDVRVLPCEGKHCFHQSCVDPWLLELSSSCPICRHDFLALENMISGRTDDGHGAGEVDNNDTSGAEAGQQGQHLEPPHENHHGNRFSRYVRFAIGRHRRRHDEPDPTDPYMPQAPETTIYSAV
ncbi:hypothetical protein DFP72DRAFT_519061 [Ephemerocybe angulata]|uniref:RING-type domain-containing protein n=1 Tax=Ephemerocybe angulata TaxID=980116 RepID=A0A8H6IFP2_9AGAR|nr:hypothetical protein DFP72DRAFT_519061 [Tulosesus angulatus]